MSTQDMMDEQNSEFSETSHMNDDERFTSTEEELQFVKQKLEEREEQLSKAVGMLLNFNKRMERSLIQFLYSTPL